jgi:hypothetical protein
MADDDGTGLQDAFLAGVELPSHAQVRDIPAINLREAGVVVACNLAHHTQANRTIYVVPLPHRQVERARKNPPNSRMQGRGPQGQALQVFCFSKVTSCSQRARRFNPAKPGLCASFPGEFCREPALCLHPW